MMEWVKTHPLETLALGTVLLSSVLNLVIKHWGESSSKLRRVVGFVIDLLSLVHNVKGSKFSGLHVPGLSVSKKDKE